MKNTKKSMRTISIALLILLLFTSFLLITGVIWIGEPSRKQYPVRGVDVSHYQGTIDWSAIAKQDIRFAFIKATEIIILIMRVNHENTPLIVNRSTVYSKGSKSDLY